MLSVAVERRKSLTLQRTTGIKSGLWKNLSGLPWKISPYLYHKIWHTSIHNFMPGFLLAPHMVLHQDQATMVTSLWQGKGERNVQASKLSIAGTEIRC